MTGKAERQSDEAMRLRLLETAYELVKVYGVVHTSIERLTAACGIGKGTFYRYYPSKESLILALMEKQAADSREHFRKRLNGREKMTAQEGREYIKFVINRDDTLYRHLTRADLQKLMDLFPQKADELRPGGGTDTIAMLLSHMEGVRRDADIPLIANLIRVCAVAFLHWDESKLFPSREEVGEMYYAHLFTLIFEGEQ